VLAQTRRSGKTLNRQAPRGKTASQELPLMLQARRVGDGCAWAVTWEAGLVERCDCRGATIRAWRVRQPWQSTNGTVWPW
jgi:hypothetical protein